VGFSRDSEECRVNWNSPSIVPLSFIRDSTYTLAVRASNHGGWINAREYWPKGFNLQMSAEKSFPAEINKMMNNETAYKWFFTGAPLAFAILHMFLFYFNRKSLSNLHYSIFTFACAGLTFCIMGVSANSSYLEFNLNFTGFKIFLILLFISGLKFLYGVFYDTLPPQYKFFGIGAVVMLSFVWYIAVLEIYMLGFICLAEQLRVVFMANVKKLHGARIIGLGYILFAILSA